MTTVGVLVMAYGTPRDRADIETYYTDIRRGRPPTPELLADARRSRYDALAAGPFPLRDITERGGIRSRSLLRSAMATR